MHRTIALIGFVLNTSQTVEAPELVELVPTIVKAVEIPARSWIPAGGPLFIDVHSFVGALQTAGETAVDRDTVSQLLAAAFAFRSAPGDEVVRCDTDESRSYGACWILDYGIHLQLDSLLLDGVRVHAFVRSTTTFFRPPRDDPPYPFGSTTPTVRRYFTATCTQEFQVTLLRKDERIWQVQDWDRFGVC